MNNSKTKNQKNVEKGSTLVINIFTVFAAIDGLSSSIDFVSFTKALWGTIFACCVALVLYLFPVFKRKTKEGKGVIINKFGSQIYWAIFAFISALWIPVVIKTVCNLESTEVENSFKPVFTPNDTSSFNVLILRFEDYITGRNTYCIGRSIKEHLSVVQANEDLGLSINAHYVDSIPPPRDVRAALRIQQQHNADLVIYGLAKNVSIDCEGADVCFRYNISESIIKQVAPVINIKPYKHDLSYIKTSPMRIEKGSLRVNKQTFKEWIKALINVKADKLDVALLELDAILNDSKTNKPNHCLSIGNTYYTLKQYDMAAAAFGKAISLDSKNVYAYSERGNSYFYLAKYELAISDYTKVISLDSKNAASAYTNRGNTYRIVNKYEHAIEDYNKAIALDSTIAVTYNNLGITYHLKGEN